MLDGCRDEPIDEIRINARLIGRNADQGVRSEVVDGVADPRQGVAALADEHRHVARHEVEDDFIFGTVADHYGHPFQPLAVSDATHHAFQQRLSA